MDVHTDDWKEVKDRIASEAYNVGYRAGRRAGKCAGENKGVLKGIVLATALIVLGLVIARPAHAHERTDEECAWVASVAKSVAERRDAGESPWVIAREWAHDMILLSSAGPKDRYFFQDEDDLDVGERAAFIAFRAKHLNPQEIYDLVLEDCKH